MGADHPKYRIARSREALSPLYSASHFARSADSCSLEEIHSGTSRRDGVVEAP